VRRNQLQSFLSQSDHGETFMDCVVGSGPAGVACAAALLHCGRNVLMLDAGLRLEPERAQVVQRLGQQTPQQWCAEDLARIKEGMNFGAAGIPQKVLFGSDYPYRDAERELGLAQAGIGLQASLALGGLSTVWGSAMVPYCDADIADWPITPKQLAPHYRAVLELTGISAGRDELEKLFPLHTDSYGQLDLSRQAKTIWQKLERHNERLKANGFLFGRARVAIKGSRGDLEPGCVHCGLFMYGCPYGYIYNSADTVLQWTSKKNFTYQPDVIVESVEEKGDQVVLRGHERGINETIEVKADRVFLAAGVIPTTGILLRSLSAHESAVFIKDSQYFLLPAMLTKRVGSVRTEPLYALSQIFIELLDAQISPRTVHLQLYTYNDLIGRAVRNIFGPLKAPLDFLARELEGRLVLFQGFIHSDQSSLISTTLRSPENGGKLELKPVINPEARKVVGRVVRRLLKNSLRFGAVPLPMLLQVAAPGRGFHAGGSFPMRVKPAGLETDTFGRPAGWQRIHAVDATVLPSIGATTITFTVMANAHRIATAATEA
jgi:choline dehydrogenase-like flavoprotein